MTVNVQIHAHDLSSVIGGLKKGADGMTSAIRMSINKASSQSRTASADIMRSKVNFPAGYLPERQGGQLTLGAPATNNKLSRSITAQGRGTSLARFSRNATRASARRLGGVSVVVTPGQGRFMQGAFVMPLRSGNQIAYRTDKMKGTRRAKRMSKHGKNAAIFLLYGPSVYQVFNKVIGEVQPITDRDFTNEFKRQVRRLGL